MRDIKIIKGDYPYSDKNINKILVKAKILNKRENSIEITNFFLVLAKKINTEGGEILIKKASVVDKTHKIFLI